MRKLRFGVLGAAKIAREKVIPPLQRSQRCEVVALGSRDLARGREVAQALGISAHTVRNHLKAVYQKLGVHSLEELVALGADQAEKPTRVTKRKPTAPGLNELADRLGDRLDTRVRVEGRSKIIARTLPASGFRPKAFAS